MTRPPTRRQRKREQAALRAQLARGGYRKPARTLRGRAAVLVYGGALVWFGASLALVIALGPTLVGWAEAAPGGPLVFLILLALSTTAALLVAGWCSLRLAHPGPAEPGRAPRSRLIAGTAVAGAVALLLLAVMASALPARGGEQECPGRADLGCAIYRNAIPELLTGLGTAVLLLATGSMLLYRYGPGRRDRAPDPT